MARAFEFQVSARKLLLGLLVTVVPVSLAAIYASTAAGRNAEQSAGSHLQTIAESVASHIRESVRAKVVEAALMASDSAVQAAVRESNRQYQRVYEEEILKRIQEKDEQWNTPAGAEAASAMLASPASEALRRKLRVQPAFLRITVTDRRGATVAATHKTIDYYQGDEEYWQDIFATGRGAVSLTDVLYDDASKHHYIGVGVPVVNENNDMIGTLDALVDISTLFPFVHQSDLGPGGRISLVRADGLVIAGSDLASLADRTTSPDYEAIVDAQDRFKGVGSGYMNASFSGEGERLLAFADTGLGSEFRRLAWHVVASQSAPLALQQAAFVQLIIMGIALLTLACVVFLAVYFSLHRPSEIEEIEEQMAERPVTVA